MPATKLPIVESLQQAEDNFHGFSVFILGIGIVFLFLTLTRFLLGIMTCLDLIFDRASAKASKKVENAKKRAGPSKKSSKTKKRSSTSKTSKTSKPSSKRSSKSTPSTKKEKNDLKKRGPANTSQKATKLSGSLKKKEAKSESSSKKDGATNSSSGKKFKRWIVEKRGNKSSNSINATSLDLLATPKLASQLKPSSESTTTTTAKSVTFKNVPEPASNTAYKYSSVATTWPGAAAPNPSLNSSPHVPGAAKTPKPGDNKIDNSASHPKRALKEYTIYAPHEVPSKFATDYVKTAGENSNASSPAKNERLEKTPSKNQEPSKKPPHQTVVTIPSSTSMLSVQSTPQVTSDTQNSLTLQSPVLTTANEEKEKKKQL